jgi:hypothetical protein
LDSTEIAAGLRNDGLGAPTRAAVLKRGRRQQQRTDDAGTQDLFVAGMIYVLSCQLLPSAPDTPGLTGPVGAQKFKGGQW